jgi:hypothetical protein
MSTALTRSFPTIPCGQDVWLAFDTNELHTRPLSDFGDGDIRAMGRTIGTLPGLGITLLGIHTSGTLSEQCAVVGGLRNLSDWDYSRFVDKTCSNHEIMEFLRTGVGLQSGSSITFTPIMLLFEISPMLQRTLDFINSRPSLESAKDDLTYHVTGEGTRYSQIGQKSEQTLSSESEELLLSTVAAVGHTHEILGLLAQNRQLKYDQCGPVRSRI